MVFPKLTMIYVTQHLFLPGDWKAPEARKPWSVYTVLLPSNLGPWKPQVMGRHSRSQEALVCVHSTVALKPCPLET